MKLQSNFDIFLSDVLRETTGISAEKLELKVKYIFINNVGKEALKSEQH